MKTLTVVVSCLIATNAMALDFDTEWAKFNSDFSKFKSHKVAMVQPKVEVEVSAVPVEDVVKVDPKSPDRLGHTLVDPTMRDKVTSLYKKPDTVVYATTIR